jgi:hypothetical protein
MTQKKWAYFTVVRTVEVNRNFLKMRNENTIIQHCIKCMKIHLQMTENNIFRETVLYLPNYQIITLI